MKLYSVLIFILITAVLGINAVTYKTQLLDNWKKESHWSRISFASGDFENLFLGDSRTYYGVNPKDFENAFIYAFPANSFSKYYLNQAEKLLKAKGSIFLGITPESLTEFQMNDAILKHRKNTFFFWDYLKSLIRVWWPNWNLATLLKRGWSSVEMKIDKNNYPIKFHTNGWWEAFPIKKDPKALENHYKMNLSRFPVQQRFIKNLQEKIAEWKGRDIKVYAFYPPVSQSVREAEDDYTKSRFDRQKVKETLKVSGAQWIEINPDAYQTFDGDHLDGLEARKLTKDLIKALPNKAN